jgi:glucokinase
VENDANVAALAECVLGQRKGSQIQFVVHGDTRTGVGSGIILNGRIWQGMNGMAGESGHVSIDPEGPMCACGTRGCLELSASATGLVRLAGNAQNLESGIAANLGQKPDLRRRTCSIWQRGAIPTRFESLRFKAEHSAVHLASLVNSLNLPLYVVGGGVAAGWELFALNV